MRLESLERFVMDTIDVILANPDEYEPYAVKSTVAYRFELYREFLQGGSHEHLPSDPQTNIKIHKLPKEALVIKPPKTHRIKIEGFTTKEET